MDEIKIRKAVEQEQLQEQESNLKTTKESASSASAPLIIALIMLVAGVILFFALKGEDATGDPTGATTEGLSLDQLHALNLKGKLPPSQGYIYNLYSFVKYDGLWWTEVKVYDTLVKIPLHFGPKEVEFIPLKGNLNPIFNQQEEVFIAIDPKVADKFYTLSISELSLNLAQGIGRTPRGSCTEEAEVCINRTIISCDNNQGKPVIELQLQEDPAVEFKGTCMLIKGNEYNLVRATDRLLYKWYGIMS